MPRGTKGKAKRKAGRGGNILNLLETVTIPPAVTADQYAATEAQIAALNLERDVMIDFLTYAGIPMVISPVPRPANADTCMLPRDIEFQANIDEEKDSKEIDEEKEIADVEEEKEVDDAEEEPVVVDEVKEEPVVVDSVDSLCEESSELENNDLVPSVAVMNPPIEAMQGMIKKMMEFKFNLSRERENNKVSIQCCAGQGDEPPATARSKYQEARIRRVSHRIAHMRRSLGEDDSNDPAVQLDKLRKTYDEAVFKKVQAELGSKLTDAEVACTEQQKADTKV